MSKRDFYDILGVGRHATPQQIKKAWRQLAMTHHPDRNPDNAEAARLFREVTEAYETLSEPSRRAIYDQFGHDGLEGTRMGTGAGFSSVEDIFAPFSDLLGEVFGFQAEDSPQPSRQRRAGRDIQTTLTLSFEEAVFGCTKELRFSREIVCQACHGEGTPPGVEPLICPSCEGEGKLTVRQGFFSMTSECTRCDGLGILIAEYCEACGGDGVVHDEHSVQISIPGGVQTGTRLKVPGRGEAGELGGPRGDVLVSLKVDDHMMFQRDGRDLIYEATVPFTRAILGGEVNIPTLDGSSVTIILEPGSQPGQQIRVEGHGAPQVGGRARGDLLVALRVELPHEISADQRALLERFEALAQRARFDEEPPTLDGQSALDDAYASLGDVISSAQHMVEQTSETA